MWRLSTHRVLISCTSCKTPAGNLTFLVLFHGACVWRCLKVLLVSGLLSLDLQLYQLYAIQIILRKEAQIFPVTIQVNVRKLGVRNAAQDALLLFRIVRHWTVRMRGIIFKQSSDYR
jgi:hypothetical protein